MWPRWPLSGTRRGNLKEGDPDSPGGAQECQREDLHGAGQKPLYEIESGGEHLWRTYVPLGTKRNGDDN